MSIEDLPARRALPDDVRDRLRTSVHEGIAKPHRKTHVWYAAAAAVLVLAAGAVVVTRQVRPPADTAPAVTGGGGLTLDAELATASLDRCWAAVRAAGKTDRVPPRAEWVPLFTAEQEGDAVVAATAAGKPLFCETTGTTVTLSDPGATPAYAPGTRTGLLLRSATGLAAGVVDPALPRADFIVKTGGGSVSSWRLRFSPVSRQFVAFTGALPAKSEVAVGDRRANALPDAPAPLLAVTDRPEPADRTSAAGRALGECLTDADVVIPDAAAYRPGPLLKEGGYQVVMGAGVTG